jgi:DNA repair protein RecN (Recombination protein N)
MPYSGRRNDRRAEVETPVGDPSGFCVTHMAQISAAADRHYIIEKETLDERTHTMIRSLEKKEREEEVARLLSGDRYDKTSLDLAARLIAGRSWEFLASDLEEKD